MVTLGLAGATAPFDPLILLILALGIEAYVGDAAFVFRRIKHPIAIIGALIGFFDDKLNRPKRSQVDRAIRGAFVVIFMIALTGSIGVGVMWLTLHVEWGWVLECLLLVTLLAGRSLYDAVARVAKGLELDGLQGGRDAVRHIVGRDPNSLDAPGIARAAVESLAENFSDAVAAPVFWYVLLGFPGILVYKTVNTMDSMIGHKTPLHQAFGFTAARLDDALNAIPARLSALIFAAAALFVPTANPSAAIKTAVRDAGKHRSFNAGWPEGAMAGALGIALAGPRTYGGEVVNDHWMGDGRARLSHKDIERALYLYGVACLITGGIVAGIAAVRL
ncbi:MAG: cobalamin biosynthesis protein CobD [Rhodospirillales bacterium]|nr:cobalamin biosynthesis protein CobD [Rhodospirillales bacterium]MBO6788439.1 cobalamin biosynthesis protein CobD [Rhodospirillales bacterium]